MKWQIISGCKFPSTDSSQTCCKATQLSRMLLIDLALTVHLAEQSTLNRGYSNYISFSIFCSTPSNLGDLLIRLKILYVVFILSFKIRTCFTISPTAKFKAHPKQCLKNGFGYFHKHF